MGEDGEKLRNTSKVDVQGSLRYGSEAKSTGRNQKVGRVSFRCGWAWGELVGIAVGISMLDTELVGIAVGISMLDTELVCNQ
jgi:hypothetical protein